MALSVDRSSCASLVQVVESQERTVAGMVTAMPNGECLSTSHQPEHVK